MANNCKLLWLLFTVFLTSFSTANKMERNYKKDSKYVVKTFKTEAGEYVDCVNMYKQPAFNHPLLVNHSIQIHPTSGAHTTKYGASRPVKYGHKHNYRCPNGYIPIKRNHNSAQHFKKYPTSNQPPYKTHKYAIITGPATSGTVNGINGKFNVWKPVVNDVDTGFSLSQLWLSAGSYDANNLNTMEVGWQVSPLLYRNDEPALFIYWTNNAYQGGDNSGCYNLKCPGFVQTSSDMIIGASLPVSTYGGSQTEFDVIIRKDAQTGNWWLYINESPIGYWPKALFTTLADAGDTVQWGGEVTDSSSQMGSGHLSEEGYTKASYIRSIKYFDTQGTTVSPTSQQLIPDTTNPTCYDLQVDSSQELFLFFGGPGCSV